MQGESQADGNLNNATHAREHTDQKSIEDDAEPKDDSTPENPRISSEDASEGVHENAQETDESLADDAQASGSISQTSIPEKKPRTPPRTPEERALDSVISEQKKINERVEAARLKVAASKRKTVFAETLKVIHTAMLGADKSSRDKVLAAFNILLDGKKRDTLLNYRTAVAAEIAALEAAAKVKAEAQKKVVAHTDKS